MGKSRLSVMPAAATKPFVYIAGSDDFLVVRLAKERFETLAKEAGADDFSREIVNGFANNLEEVAQAVARFRDAVQTVPMFGGKRVVWFKDISFLADNVTGRSEGVKEYLELLQDLLEKTNADEVAVVLSAAPVDRRRSFAKWCETHGEFTLAGGGEGEDKAGALAQVIVAEARAEGVKLDEGAVELLLAKIGANTRLLTEEVRKLATYASEGGAITEAMVAELTPNVAEGDFFEAADCFFAGDLPKTLAALERHFFAGGDARPLLASLQNRNRILIQARVLLDSGELPAPSAQFGFNKQAWARAQESHASRFGGDAEKSSFNLFTQNQWYAGKLVSSGKLPPLRRLIDNQQEFVRAFEDIIGRADAQHEILRDMAVRCLGA